jgi:hypothetical protein
MTERIGRRRATAALAVGLLVGVWSTVEALSAVKPGSPPAPVSATTVGDGVLIRFHRKVRGAPPPTAFILTVNGKTAAPAAVKTGTRAVRVSMPSAVYSDDLVRIRYVASRAAGALGLRGEDGSRVAGFVFETVNKGPAGCVDPLGTVTPATASEGPTDVSYFLPSVGRIGLAYVPVDFNDSRDGIAPGLRFTPPGPGAVPAVVAPILSDLSYGRLSAEVAPAIGVVRMSKDTGAYGLGVVPTWDDARPFLTEALEIATLGADFSRTDVVFVEMNGKRGTSLPSGPSGFEQNYVVMAPPGQGIVVDGREIRAVVFANGRSWGESLVPPLLRILGLPKLRDRQDQLGVWDSMVYVAPGQAPLFGWHRRKLGWLDPTQVRCVRAGRTELTLAPLSRSGGMKLVVVPVSRTAAVVVELRRREGQDAKNCRDGLLVTRLDTAIPIHDPLVTPPMRVVLTRPLPPVPVLPGSEAFQCGLGLLFAQVLDPTVTQVGSDGVTVTFVTENPDGSAVVRIER